MFDLQNISQNLFRSQDGVWRLKSTDGALEPISYPLDGNADYFEIESSSFWFAHRNACICAAARASSFLTPIFDIGGGNGFVSKGLQDAGYECVVIEPGPTGARNAAKRGVNFVVEADFASVGLSKDSIPTVGLFDVLEHIENDQQFLQEIAELIEPGGKIIITTPAFRFLWSNEDTIAGHFRRYKLLEIRNLFASLDFEIEYETYFFSLLVVPIFFLRSVRSLWGKIGPKNASLDAHSPPKKTAGILDRLLAFERRRMEIHKKIPIGSSCLVIARKRP